MKLKLWLNGFFFGFVVASILNILSLSAGKTLKSETTDQES